MSNTMLSRIKLAKRRCDVDHPDAIGDALQVSPLVLLQGAGVA
ncbi:XRE family transcriptional regulator [Streptomyces griseorubens]